jgi:hypothetical protein
MIPLSFPGNYNSPQVLSECLESAEIPFGSSVLNVWQVHHKLDLSTPTAYAALSIAQGACRYSTERSPSFAMFCIPLGVRGNTSRLGVQSVNDGLRRPRSRNETNRNDRTARSGLESIRYRPALMVSLLFSGRCCVD